MIWRKPRSDTLLREAHAALAPLLAPEAIDSLVIEDGHALLALRTTREGAPELEARGPALVAALCTVNGIDSARMVLTAERPPNTAPAAISAPTSDPAPPAAPRPNQPRTPGFGHGVAGHRIDLPAIGRILAIASGKGGVGKSTSAVNIALALAETGQKIGLLDADIHGPSLPTMLGIHTRPPLQAGRMQPIPAFGLQTMSMGYLVDPEQAVIWRGPMVAGAIQQLLGQVDWGTLDCLVIDLPPGTGDAQLTLVQSIRLDGAIIISTPQDVALADARRGCALFTRMQVPVLGMVENMSYYCCPECGARSDLFGHGGARLEANRLGVPFLGEVPLLRAVRAAADRGQPIFAAEPAGEAARAYRAIAARLLADG